VVNGPATDMRLNCSFPKATRIVVSSCYRTPSQHFIARRLFRYRVPAINWSRTFAEGGGLISYGPSLVDEYRRAATYADRILKGEKPSELPVQTPVKFELVINVRTAKTFGLTVPDKLRAFADEVIE
jgi:putative tryptophan/tyrosine transport system substrate-binding protein